MQSPQLCQSPPPSFGPPETECWHQSELLAFSEAEELLDLIERSGIAEPEVLFVKEWVVVRWRQPLAS